MSPNPYEPPAPYQSSANPNAYGGAPAPMSKTPFILAAVGAWLAAAYWGLMTLLIMFGALSGRSSGAQSIIPFVLVGLYAFRGIQLFQGNPAAARRILWLHCVGAFFALLQAVGMALTGALLVCALQGIKVAINVFGAITAYLAVRAYKEAVARGAIDNQMGQGWR